MEWLGQYKLLQEIENFRLERQIKIGVIQMLNYSYSNSLSLEVAMRKDQGLFNATNH